MERAGTRLGLILRGAFDPAAVAPFEPCRLGSSAAADGTARETKTRWWQLGPFQADPQPKSSLKPRFGVFLAAVTPIPAMRARVCRFGKLTKKSTVVPGRSFRVFSSDGP